MQRHKAEGYWYQIVVTPKDPDKIKWTEWFHGGEGVYAQFNTRDGSMARLRWDQRWQYFIKDKFCQRKTLKDGRILWTVYVDNDAQDHRWTWRASALVEIAYSRYLSAIMLANPGPPGRRRTKPTRSSPSAKVKPSSD